ncbi:hypothetical protein BRCON_1676 [Candidatus Sumerlaea chitinivorans]|uniref:Uncharacterized protein n=1 Tax=Sumerlaea chitinivorans TaxID=2250252 RepID=A0A2Z4Y7Q1_SUMC1|nr:hypothetical protein BRCON_1676 [Candidatus Sumerlaea chitinivorans]
MNKRLDTPEGRELIFRIQLAQRIIEPEATPMMAVHNVDELEIPEATVRDPYSMQWDKEAAQYEEQRSDEKNPKVLPQK